jgi:hypothetical protein
MKSILLPFGGVCVQYYDSVDSVYPVCKKWDAKAKSVSIKGVVEDGNPRYSPDVETSFRFMDQQPRVDVLSIRDNKLKCEGENEDTERYKDNVRLILEELEITVGRDESIEGALERWSDKGSTMSELDVKLLMEIYSSIYGHNVLPLPCFTLGARPNPQCSNPDNTNKPRIEMQIDWEGAREGCINNINNLCDELCGGLAKPTYTETFCKSMFPDGRVGGGKGELVCQCGSSEIKIDSMTFGF